MFHRLHEQGDSMHTEFLMGNEAIALGALAAGVNVVAGYPGTPSTEVLETVAKRKQGNVYVEWSVNEKAAMEVAAGAAYAGARALVTCKQVGLNVASDPLMSLEYIGVKGGMVVLVADDPGPISSQTEQDTRTFAQFSKLPLFDPSGVQEAYEMIQEAFELSEQLGTPVFMRPTTRVDHGYEAIEVAEPAEWKRNEPEGFVKDSSRWVIFPRLSVVNHAKIEARNAQLSETFSDSPRNFVVPDQGSVVRKGIATHGISYTYVSDNLDDADRPRVLRVGTPFPFPERKAVEFLTGLDEVLCVEELDPVIERALISVCGKYGLTTKIRGKLTGDIQPSGENTVESVGKALANFLGNEAEVAGGAAASAPAPQKPAPAKPDFFRSMSAAQYRAAQPAESPPAESFFSGNLSLHAPEMPEQTRLDLSPSPISTRFDEKTQAATGFAPAPGPQIVENSVQNVEKSPVPDHKILGEALKTYILVEVGETLLLIDKHAAHERMNFDRLKAMDRQILSQTLLAPVTLRVDPGDGELLEQYGELLGELGFAIEPFGRGEAIIRAVPADILPSDAVPAVEEILEKLRRGKAPDPRSVKDELLHTVACKAAIKAGWDTSRAELERIVQEVLSGRVKYCPHGRPVSAVLSKKDLEKMFKRIV